MKADEGMWLPNLLSEINEEDMYMSGLRLTADDLYSVNNSSLKDAIVSLGGFCTAEMISDQGLMMTNHHCAFGLIQDHSSVNKDYLTDGFWAMNKNEELPNEGLTATFLISIESATERVLHELDSLKESSSGSWNRDRSLQKIFSKISKKKTEGTNYNARVKSFFGGNEFYLMTYITYKDVRLVGAPPSSIGKFGGDTDNWMWPRHTGDFALLRVYCAADGSPADFSEDNVPYQPKHHLPIQLDGVNEGDYTMIFGFPGRTDRYLTSYGVKQAIEQYNPTVVSIRDKKLSVMKEFMDADKNTAIQYAAKHAQTSNYWKYYIGQTKGLKSMKVYDKKLNIEKNFLDWVNTGESKRHEKYHDVLDRIDSAYQLNEQINVARIYLNEAIFQGPEILYFSWRMNNNIKFLSKDAEERNAALLDYKEQAKEFYKNYNPILDQNLLSSMLEMYYDNVPKEYHSDIFRNIIRSESSKSLDFDNYAKNVFRRSIFSDELKFNKFLKNPSYQRIKRDPAYLIMSSIYNSYIQNIYPIRKSVRAELSEGNRIFIKGLLEMYPNKKFYSNANSTMRVTYGNVYDYKAADAVYYDYYTTIDGIMQKEDSLDQEFIVPKKLIDLYNIGDYGRYADQDGNLRVNFISNNDITGGNSGSPVINAWGEIVGVAFDGNWEAMSGDIAFENTVQRTISVDIRYIMFIIDKFAESSHLIEEMTIAPSRINKNPGFNLLDNALSDFERSFANARSLNKKTFIYNGKSYHTKIKSK